ncbi:MAG: PspC domain-containing protein [Oscillospiraceae bacterium]|nr:PspC domain-containing protein [Oscillospiraceae bacterium]MCD8375327.1 PspC domain-containing protein [Oscillospiraceae bacterium]
MGTKKLYRLEKHQGALLAGVCGGLAEYFNLDPSIVRLIFVALTVLASVGFWVYVVAAIILPKKSDVYPGY